MCDLVSEDPPLSLGCVSVCGSPADSIFYFFEEELRLWLYGVGSLVKGSMSAWRWDDNGREVVNIWRARQLRWQGIGCPLFAPAKCPKGHSPLPSPVSPLPRGPVFRGVTVDDNLATVSCQGSTLSRRAPSPARPRVLATVRIWR